MLQPLDPMPSTSGGHGGQQSGSRKRLRPADSSSDEETANPAPHSTSVSAQSARNRCTSDQPTANQEMEANMGALRHTETRLREACTVSKHLADLNVH